jgi:signal transduction histidine kinase
MIDRLSGSGAAAVGIDLMGLYAESALRKSNEVPADGTTHDERGDAYCSRDGSAIRAGMIDFDSADADLFTSDAAERVAWVGTCYDGHPLAVGTIDRQLAPIPSLLDGAFWRRTGFDILTEVTKEDCSRMTSAKCSESYETYSYMDVLQGKVPSGKLNGRLVLISAAGKAPGARLVAPTGEALSLASIDIAADENNALAASMITGGVGLRYELLFNEIVVFLTCVLLYLLGPRAGLVAFFCVSIAIAAACYLVFAFEHRFMRPATDTLVCAAAYMLWAWRRLEAVLRFMALEAERMAAEPSLPEKPVTDRLFIDPVQRQLNMTAVLDERVRRYRELIDEWVDSLPEATLIASTAGTVMLANERASMLSQHPEVTPAPKGMQVGRSVSEVLFQMTASHRAIEFVSQALTALDHWTHSVDLPAQTESLLEQGIEIANTRRGRSLLIKCAPIKPSAYRDGALIFHVADVSSVRMAERQRDMALRFLSHDMRSPQASILALAGQAMRDPSRYTIQKFAELVSQYATQSLSLSDDFLFLAKADSLPPKLSLVDPALVLGDAIDDLLPQASEKSTVVNLIAEPGQSTVADVQLLRRAFANLIGNAIKFSPESSSIDVHLSETERHVKISVTDHGIGISEHDIGKLFREFTQLDGRSSRSGHGLGLAFVKTVVDSLGGRLLVQSKLGEGATFLMFLPKHDHDVK